MQTEQLPLPLAQRSEEITEQDVALLLRKAEELQRELKKPETPRRIPLVKRQIPVS